jgi:hypothetical protein
MSLPQQLLLLVTTPKVAILSPNHTAQQLLMCKLTCDPNLSVQGALRHAMLLH